MLKSSYKTVMEAIPQNLSFGAEAASYQRYRRSYDPRLYALLFSLLPKGDLSILDIGCGTGKSTEPLVAGTIDQSVSVVGIDPDPSMLRVARESALKKHIPIEYVQGYAEQLPFERESFDAVIAGAAFHWFATPQALESIRIVLKPGGLVFLFWSRLQESERVHIGADVYKRYDWKGPPSSFKDKETAKRMLIDAGFKGVDRITIPFTESLTLAHAIGVIKTNSSYLVMAPAVQKRFISDMTHAYKQALGKERYVTEKLELWVYIGFK